MRYETCIHKHSITNATKLANNNKRDFSKIENSESMVKFNIVLDLCLS